MTAGDIGDLHFGVSPLEHIEQECRCRKPHLHANLHRLLVARHLAHHPDDILDLLPYGCEDSDVVNAKRLLDFVLLADKRDDEGRLSSQTKCNTLLRCCHGIPIQTDLH